MYPSIPKRAFLAILCLYICLQSCSKSNNCPETPSIIYNLNETVIVGFPLRLEAETQTTGYIYKWSGPNGWGKQYDTNTSDAYVQVRENMTVADAGEYRLQLINTDGCADYEEKTMVEVKSTPTCSPAANTSTSSIAGLGNFNFATRTFVAGNGHYAMTGGDTAPGDYLAIVFPNDILPEPGIYETGEQMGTEPGKVGVFIAVAGNTYLANPGQPVFVSRVNNKIEITFCWVHFENLNPANPLIISAKIVEP